jgi:transposase
MLQLPTLSAMDRALAVKVYLAVGATDMRKGFDSLAALVRDHLGHDPLSGSLFLFIGRDRDRIKALLWETDGYCLWYKRLEEGTFRVPPARDGGASVELKASELAMLLEGIDLARIKRRRRFPHPGPPAPGR